jgi:lysine 6-dehydrogenase
VGRIGTLTVSLQQEQPARRKRVTDTFGILGSGRQGTAAAYDLAVAQDASLVVMFDVDPGVAGAAAARVNALANREVACPQQLDVADEAAVAEAIAPLGVVICATPFRFIPGVTRAAIQAGTGMVDLGGHTQTVLDQLELDAEAREAGIGVVPDCGMGPGLNNTIGMYLVDQLEKAGATDLEVHLYDGGLPQDRSGPWGYRSTFHINGLTNEYDGQALFVRDGQRVPVDTLTEIETLDFGELGTLEAFVTSGGTSTAPYSLEGRVQVYENKTVRYPGHLDAFRAFKELGLFDETPIDVEGTTVTPRAVFHRLLGPRIGANVVEDVCVMRAIGRGKRDGEPVERVLDLVDRYDPATGFSAMERLTGWHAAIMAGFVADGTVPPGVHPVEKAANAGRFLEEVRRRGFAIEER